MSSMLFGIQATERVWSWSKWISSICHLVGGGIELPFFA